LASMLRMNDYFTCTPSKRAKRSVSDNMLPRERQYKRRIKDWGLDKNLKNCEMKAIVRKQQRRTAEGKRSVFEVKGRQVEPSKIERARKRYEHFNTFATSQHSPPARESRMRPSSWSLGISNSHD
jgi:hypothetical protein